jgi:hypothetical protein
MALATKADLKEFSDWATASGPTFVFQVTGYVSRFKPNGDPDADIGVYKGVVHYSNPEQFSTPSSIQIWPGDFFAAMPLWISPPVPTPQVLVSLAVGNPITADLQFLGGPIDGTTVHSTVVHRDANSLPGYVIVLLFRNGEHGEHLYRFDMWKEGYQKPFAKLNG